MIAVLTLLSRGGLGAVLRWNIGGKVFSRVSSNDTRELIGARQARIDWVEVQLPLPSHAWTASWPKAAGGT